ncbi:MAG TPA: hypothetical protein PKO15_03265 [Fibrobacteria bacterium]|nr:hypothetical protein [Fibrobacteria bacterium]
MNLRASVGLALAFLAGCAPTSRMASFGFPDNSCPIAFDSSLFQKVSDTSLVRAAVHDPDSGGMRCAIALALRPGRHVTVHRVYGSPARPIRRWWALSLPGSDSSAYRAMYEICPAWNSLDSLVSCELAPGARLAMGPGQSASCTGQTGYPVSDSLQVFLANPSRDLDTARCRYGRMEWR